MGRVGERLRPWAERAVLLVAAAAVVATSPARWRLSATAPGSSPLARVVTIEASERPQMWGTGVGGQSKVFAWKGQKPGSPWPGRADYLVMPGWNVTGIELAGLCASGGCGRSPPCVPPAGAFVRVAGVTPVESWSTSADTTATTGPGAYEVRVEASRMPDVAAVPASGTPATLGTPILYDASDLRHLTPPHYVFRIEWPAAGTPAAFTWTARAVIGDDCPSPTAICTAPPTETVSIAPIVGAE
jgi:hypothetical protein